MLYSVDCASRLISISSVTETEQKHKESERNSQRERDRERETSVGNDVIHTHFSVFKGALPFFFFRAPLICPHCSLKDLSATVKSSKFTRDLITFSPLGQQVIYLPSNIMLNERIMTSS